MKLRCERQIGRILAELEFQGGDRKSFDRGPGLNLDDLGISRTQSSRWQWEGLAPDEDFLRFVQKANEERRELTSGGLLRLAQVHRPSKAARDEKNPFTRLANGLKDLARQQQRFACVYADPPWGVVRKGSVAELRRRLCRLPVKAVTAPRAHLHLRVPADLLELGLGVLRAWGFRYHGVLASGRCRCNMGIIGGRSTTCCCRACAARFPSATPVCRVGWRGSTTARRTRFARSAR